MPVTKHKVYMGYTNTDGAINKEAFCFEDTTDLEKFDWLLNQYCDHEIITMASGGSNGTQMKLHLHFDKDGKLIK